jgi:hypothetical protein
MGYISVNAFEAPAAEGWLYLGDPNLDLELR